MTNAELYISELRKLQTPKNKAVVEGIIKGFSAIMIESQRAAGMDLDAYEQLEQHRKASKLPAKAFIESVGNTILASSYSDEQKTKMLDNLSRYASTL